MSFKIPCGGFKLDEKSFSLDENGVLSVSGGAQPDWNQNDSTAADYIKNRPFYEGDPVDTVLVEESTVSFSGDGGFYGGTIQSSFKAELGNTYKVFWDGSIYESLCTPAYEDFMIGNASIIGVGTDTGEPFIMSIYKDTNNDTIEIITTDTSESHTISISESSQLVVKIPAKFIDKDASGYIVVHKSETMTKQEALNYTSDFLEGRIAFVIWGTLHIKSIYYVNGSTLDLTLENNEYYSITENNDGLFNYNDRIFTAASLPAAHTSANRAIEIYCEKNNISISPYSYSNGVGSTNALFTVKPNGTKSKNSDVLGNGEAVTPAIILYSTTADSTKKFRVTVDDSGNLTATEV